VAGETSITVIGNLTADPELRFTPSGVAVCNFTVATTPRQFDKSANEWRDGETMFLPCGVWREAAENVAESFRKGMRVIVSGRLKSRTFETKDGDKRTVIELDAEEVGPSLRYATAQVRRTQRTGGQGQPAGGQPAAGGNDWGGTWNGSSQTADHLNGGANVQADLNRQPAAAGADPWAVPGEEPAF
jgi:single-strand DNA-binding protein